MYRGRFCNEYTDQPQGPQQTEVSCWLIARSGDGTVMQRGARSVPLDRAEGTSTAVK